MSNLIPGPKLLNHWDIMPFELFDHVKNGLQPFDKFERPIPPPTITRKLERLEELLTGLELTSFFLTSFEEPKNALEKNLKLVEAQKILNGYASRHESILNKIETLKSDIQSTLTYKLERLEKLNRKRKTISLFLSAFGSVKKVFEKNPRKANKLIILDGYASRYESMLNELKTLKRELDNIENNHSWSDYELPKNEESAERVIDLLMRSYFKKEDVEAIERANPELGQKTNVTPERLTTEPAPETKESSTLDQKALANTDHFILNLTVTYSSSTSVILKPEGKNPQEYSCDQIGFKPTAKTWMMFINVLQNDDHKFHVGIYSKDKDQIKIKNYNSLAKLPGNFSKKFVAFLNQEYSASLPEDFNVFKNMKRFDRAGIYETKFHIVNQYDVVNRTDIKKMSKEEILKKLESLCEQRQHEKNETKKESLLAVIAHYAEHAKKMGWINKEALRKMISLPDEDASTEDGMSLAVELKDF